MGAPTVAGRAAPPVAPRRRHRRDPAALPAALATVAVVWLLCLLPLAREPHFYYWDDTAAVFAPTWRAVGLDLLEGRWPTLRPDVWMGGNWAAEAQFGLWNPVNLALCVGVALLPDLAVAATLVKAIALGALALGAHLVMRDHGASPWPAAALASALPFGGFTLYYDASTWVAGLFAFAWTPWFWWVARRCLHGRTNPGWVFVVGYLTLTNGNPYGALGAVVVLTALAVEAVLTGRWAGLRRLLVVGLCIGTTAGVAYLPMALTAHVGWRGEGAAVENIGELAPDLTMLAATSSPGMLPLVRVWGQEGSTVPLTYTAWFLLPLAAWLPWGILRGRGRRLADVFVVAAVYLALTLGPSSLWLFRWPVRLVPYAFLAVGVLVAVLLSHGFATGRRGVRLALSLGTVAVGGWLSVAARPDLAVRHLAATGFVAALTGLLAWAALRRPRLAPMVLTCGTAAVLACQTGWVPVNGDVVEWRFPSSVARLEAFADRYPSPVLQIARDGHIPVEDRPASREEMLFGTVALAGGAESTTSYTGIGFDAFSRTLCLNHAGNSCAGGFRNAWAPAGTLVRVPVFVDALKARTLVAHNALVPDAAAQRLPDHWAIREVTDRVTVFERTAPLPWPESRLAAVTDGVRVASASGTDTTERLVVSTGDAPGALQFARLAWPGYTAQVDGRPVPVTENAQGLIEVELPPGLTDAVVQLRFLPPGYAVAVPLLVVGAMLAGAQAAAFAWRRGPRRARSAPAARSLD